MQSTEMFLLPIPWFGDTERENQKIKNQKPPTYPTPLYLFDRLFIDWLGQFDLKLSATFPRIRRENGIS